MPTTSELFKKHEQNKLFCTNCGVPEDVRMVKISPGLDLLHYSTQPSEKNFLTVLSIQTGQKTTCINNCHLAGHEANKARRMVRGSTPTRLLPPLCPVILFTVPDELGKCRISARNSGTCLAFTSQLSNFLQPLCIGISGLRYLHTACQPAT